MEQYAEALRQLRLCGVAELRRSRHPLHASLGELRSVPSRHGRVPTHFCEAHRGSPEHRIIADALRAFIAERLVAEPELKKRYDAARRKRLGSIEGDNVTVLLKRTEQRLQTLADDFALQTAEFLVIAHDFAVKRDNPPAITLPLRRNKRGVQSARMAEAKGASLFVDCARLRDYTFAAIRGLSRFV